MAQTVRRLSTLWETWVPSLGWEDLLEKQMAIHFSTIAWKIPCTEESGRLQSMGFSMAIVLEWIAVSFSSGSSRPRDGTQASHIVDRRFPV